MIKSQAYYSSIDSSFLIFVLGTDKFDYFEKFDESDAFCDIERKVILINGRVSKYWTKDHFLAVEAHEISHYICGHKESNIKNEKEADKLSTILLNIHKFKRASNLIKIRYRDNYNSNINNFKLNFKIYLKLILFLIKNFFKREHK